MTSTTEKATVVGLTYKEINQQLTSLTNKDKIVDLTIKTTTPLFDQFYLYEYQLQQKGGCHLQLMTPTTFKANVTSNLQNQFLTLYLKSKQKQQDKISQNFSYIASIADQLSACSDLKTLTLDLQHPLVFDNQFLNLVDTLNQLKNLESIEVKIPKRYKVKENANRWTDKLKTCQLIYYPQSDV